MTADQMEILAATAERVSEMVERVKAQVNLLAVLPGGVVTSETAEQIDTAAETATELLANIDTEVRLTIAVLKNLPE